MPHNANVRPVSRFNERKAKLLATALMEDENALNPLSERWTYTPRCLNGTEWTIEVYDEANHLIGHF